MAPIKSKLEYSDEVEPKDDVEIPTIIEPTVVPEVKPPSIKKRHVATHRRQPQHA